MSVDALLWCRDGKLENALYLKFSWFPLILWKPRAHPLKLQHLKSIAANKSMVKKKKKMANENIGFQNTEMILIPILWYLKVF